MNLTGPVNSLSYGVVTRGLCRGLSALGVEVSLTPISQPQQDGIPPAEWSLLERALNRPAGGGPSLLVWHQFDLSAHRGSPKLAFPIFELDSFNPKEQEQLLAQDVVLTPSTWGKKVLAKTGVHKTQVCPLGVDFDIFHPVSDVNHGPTTFLNVGKWEVRKGHDVLCEAFNQAFAVGDDVKLILVPYNPFLGEEEVLAWERLFLESPLGRAGKITILGRLPSQGSLWQVINASDCGVFPSRAEGWNLPLAECLACGLPCICTNYSAHVEFAPRAGALLVEPDGTEPAFDGRWFFGQGDWALLGQHSLEQFIAHMRYIHQLKQRGGCPRAAGGVVMREFTWEGCARRVLEVVGW